MRIIDLSPEHEPFIRQAAELLVAGFHVHWPSAWPDMDAALAEVHEALAPGKICRVALPMRPAPCWALGRRHRAGDDRGDVGSATTGLPPTASARGSAGRWWPIWRRRFGCAAGYVVAGQRR